ncbi:hypothetical protein [Microbacterium enclense]|uniref:VG15 protein n=1 Tax=Microbacterium enclense TaxID=993073 RepID=UPI00342227E9
MTLPQSSVRHYQQQQILSVETATEVTSIWAGMTNEFDRSWASIAPAVVEATSAGQYAAAVSGAQYVGAVIAETDVDAPAVARVVPIRFAGGSIDGGSLETLLVGAVYKAKEYVGTGMAAEAALREAGTWLQDVVMEAVRDADRQAVGAGMTVRPRLQGWVRMLNPPSCKFCIGLAGKWFQWNQGFQAHPHCDCRHIPSQESDAGDYQINAGAYFRSLGAEEQDRIFGTNDAQAIRDGADINRVLNTRIRGYSAKQLRIDPDLMTVDHIYAQAKSRDQAIALLQANGFVAPTL